MPPSFCLKGDLFTMMKNAMIIVIGSYILTKAFKTTAKLSFYAGQIYELSRE